jgi:hypothetical protein
LQVAGYADWAALGAAVLAGWGIGAYPSIAVGIAHLQPHLQRLEPNPDLTDFYNQRLSVYKNFSRVISSANLKK